MKLGAQLQIACIIASALFSTGCNGGWGATPSVNPVRLPSVEMRSQLEPQTMESIVYAFKGGQDGENPDVSSLVSSKTHALYGTTAGGGPGTGGTVFKLTPAHGGYTESVLYGFKGGNDGEAPNSLILGAAGALFGTTRGGGVYFYYGTVFKLTPSRSGYVESVIYAFNGGGNPNGVIGDKAGALYGTTLGTVFKLTPSRSGYTEKTLHVFAGPPDGDSAGGGLTADKSGTLYGTTTGGGKYCYLSGGCGIVFELKPSKGGYAYRVIYNFKGPPHDATAPSGSLMIAKDGALFGTTIAGGSADWGTVFKLKRSGTNYVESLVHSFGVKPGDGQQPCCGVIADATGALYGTTTQGGSSKAGVVFKLKPSGNAYVESVLHAFPDGSADGWAPYAGLTLERGSLYGTTYYGGGPGHGTVFKVAP